MRPNQARRRRSSNDREASGSRDPHATRQGPPQARLVGGTQFTIDREPLKLHFIMLKPGAEVIENILGVTEETQKGLVMISALGTVSRAVLPRNASNSVHEGCFQIASLSGTCVPGVPSGKLGDFTVLLTDRTGAVTGGIVESLVADSNVQIVVGSFTPRMAVPLKVKQEPAQ